MFHKTGWHGSQICLRKKQATPQSNIPLVISMACSQYYHRRCFGIRNVLSHVHNDSPSLLETSNCPRRTSVLGPVNLFWSHRNKSIISLCPSIWNWILIRINRRQCKRVEPPCICNRHSLAFWARRYASVKLLHTQPAFRLGKRKSYSENDV